MIKSVLARIMMKNFVKKYMVSSPKIIQLSEKELIGYKITTTLRDNQQKKDIPPFFHEVYDNGKLAPLNIDDDFNMYCAFSMHENGESFDYFVAQESQGEPKGEGDVTLKLQQSNYVTMEFIKRNNKAVHMIMMYVRQFWMKAHGLTEKKAPAFIIYDNRFHENYKQYGCKGGNYLGHPIASLYLPVKTES